MYGCNRPAPLNEEPHSSVQNGRALQVRTVMDHLPPAYSENLSVGESRIEHSPSRRERRLRETWLQTEGSITIALSEQMKDIDVPRYVRRDHVHGALLLDNREVVSSVTIKLLGQLRAANPDGGRSLSVVEIVKILWAGDPEGTRLCSGALSFDMSFPDNYSDKQGATFMGVMLGKNSERFYSYFVTFVHKKFYF
ncbi:hypothetical protein BDZ89DRAFT_234394 [Hymenopellis radicata]|nr:hypothetical protein BDZ89DRAFT_234394 [Hymenopellis radicata]